MYMFTTLFKTDKIRSPPRNTSITGGWIKQIWHIYTMEFYSVVKNEMSFVGK